MTKQRGRCLAPHEALELHELLSSEVIGYKKLKSTLIMAEDDELKEFMRESMKNKKKNIEQMGKFIASQEKMQ